MASLISRASRIKLALILLKFISAICVQNEGEEGGEDIEGVECYRKGEGAEISVL